MRNSLSSEASRSAPRRIDPEIAIRAGRPDAHVVLVLWCVRKSFYPLLWTGLSVALVALGDLEAVGREVEALETPQALVSGLLSPFGIVALAIGLRIVGGFAGLVAAYPLTLGTQRRDYPGNRVARWFRVLWDRVYQARAYKALRQTWAVREHARQRLSTPARYYRTCETALVWANWVLLVGFFVVMVVFAGSGSS